MTTKNSNHCHQCNAELKKGTKKAHTKLRCLTCNYPISNTTKSCKKHPDAGFTETILAETRINYKCKNCGLAPINNTDKQIAKVVDRLQHNILFDRKFMQVLSNSSNGHGSHKMISSLVRHMDNKKVISEFKELWLPKAQLSMILDQTGSDKWVEKSRLDRKSVV